MTETPVARFLAALRERLGRRGPRVDRIVAEARDHLEEATERLVAAGMSEEEASLEALRRFGPPEKMARAFEAIAPAEGPWSGREAQMARLTLAALAAVTTAGALIVGLHSVFADEKAGLWLAIKLAVASFTITVGLFTFLGRRLETVPWQAARALAAAGLCALGGAAAVWTVHLGLVTGDFEFWAIGLAGLMVAQGALTVFLGMHRREDRA